MDNSDGSWTIAMIGVLILFFLCWKQAGWDQESDPEEYDPVRDCYVMKVSNLPAVETNKQMRMECK